MKRFIAIFLVLFVFASIVPAQAVGVDREVIGYVIVQAGDPDELSQKIRYYLNLNTGWQPWGTVTFINYRGSSMYEAMCQVMVQYKK